ncbi:MAG: hypothetical protein ACP5QH_04325 [Thermoplasmata archaeon]
MEIPLKIKGELIRSYLKGKNLSDLSREYNIEIEEIKRILNEWINGYFKLYDDDYYIRQIASLMLEKDLKPEDIVQGYYYYEIFRDMDKEEVMRFIISLKNMEEDRRKSLIENSLRMMKLNRYSGIDYSEIPQALDRMVLRAGELKEDIDSSERRISELESKERELEERVLELEREINRRKEYLEILLFMERHLDMGHEDIKDFILDAKKLNYSKKDLMEISRAIRTMNERGLGVEQFIRLVDYLEGLMDLGLSVSFIKNLEEDLERRGLKLQKYLKEMDDLIEDKLLYEKNVDDLKKEAKSLENQIRSMRNEIREYLKKVKPKMK